MSHSREVFGLTWRHDEGDCKGDMPEFGHFKPARVDMIGFRLSHDDVKQGVVGSSSHYPARHARTVGRDVLFAEEVSSVVGIRLTADWRTE